MGWSPDRDLQGGADAPATLPLFNMYEQSHNTATVRNCIWFMHDVPIRWMLVDVHINGWFGTENCLSRLNDVIVHPTCLSINGNPSCRQDYYERILPDVPSHCICLWQFHTANENCSLFIFANLASPASSLVLNHNDESEARPDASQSMQLAATAYSTWRNTMHAIASSAPQTSCYA